MNVSQLVRAAVWAILLVSATIALGSSGLVIDSPEFHTSSNLYDNFVEITPDSIIEPFPTVSPAPGVMNQKCNPFIEFTNVPPYGSFMNLQGQVTCIDPTNYRVAVYIFVSGWWTKPTFANPLTLIQSDGTWTTDITTGGLDQNATKIAAYLVPDGYNPPLMGGGQTLPPELEENSATSVMVEREPIYRTLEFLGYTWNVKAAEVPVGPGPNYFSDREEEVWVDEDGRLHLRIVYRNGRWYSSEVFTDAPLGYGTYSFTPVSRVDHLDPNVVLGLFTWDDTAPESNYREIDIEFSRWGEPGADNAQFVIQPWNVSGNRYRFNMELEGDYSTHSFAWYEDRIEFSSFQGHEPSPPPADEIESWLYEGAHIPPAGPANARINLWLFNGSPPSDGQGVEVVITAFEFTPIQNKLWVYLPLIVRG